MADNLIDKEKLALIQYHVDALNNIVTALKLEKFLHVDKKSLAETIIGHAKRIKKLSKQLTPRA